MISSFIVKNDIDIDSEFAGASGGKACCWCSPLPPPPPMPSCSTASDNCANLFLCALSSLQTFLMRLWSDDLTQLMKFADNYHRLIWFSLLVHYAFDTVFLEGTLHKRNTKKVQKAKRKTNLLHYWVKWKNVLSINYHSQIRSCRTFYSWLGLLMALYWKSSVWN